MDTAQRWDRTGSYVKGRSNTNTTGCKYFEFETCELCEGLILWGFRTSAHRPDGREMTTGLGKATTRQPEILEDPYAAKWFGFECLILRCGRTRQTGQDIDQMAGVEDRSGASRPPSPILSRVVNQRENNGRLGEFQVSSLFPADYLGSVWEVPSVFSESIPILLKSMYLFDSGISPSDSFSKYWNMQKLVCRFNFLWIASCIQCSAQLVFLVFLQSHVKLH